LAYRVTNNAEDLFHGGRAPLTPSENLRDFCLCDGSRRCGRRATSDTTADGSEPQQNVRLGVPNTPVFIDKRRRKRQTPDSRQNVQATGNRRTYPIAYEYESHLLHRHQIIVEFFRCIDANECCTCSNIQSANSATRKRRSYHCHGPVLL